jgi:GNAT superfamily N-acetyltransferase
VAFQKSTALSPRYAQKRGVYAHVIHRFIHRPARLDAGCNASSHPATRRLYSRPVPPPPDTTPGPLSPRRATATDLPAIKALIDAAYARYLTRMDKPPGPMLRDYGPSVEAGTTWVTGSPITAVLTLYPRGDHLLVENIAVHPGAQGRGLGRVLMSFAEEEAARRGLTRLTLFTHEVMTENQAIYARLGYTEVERRAENGYRRIYMEKRLPG